VITPQVVVDESADPEAPLYPCFERDDAIAANEHRKYQARALIRSVVAVREDPTTQAERPTIAYVSVTPAGESRGYISTARVMNDDDLRQQAIGDALAGLEGWRKRFAHLDELSPLLAAIDAQMARVKQARRKPAAPQPQPTA
jgi:hypothetical protein